MGTAIKEHCESVKVVLIFWYQQLTRILVKFWPKLYSTLDGICHEVKYRCGTIRDRLQGVFIIENFINSFRCINQSGQHLEHTNLERPIFRNVETSNTKKMKHELFDSF